MFKVKLHSEQFATQNTLVSEWILFQSQLLFLVKGPSYKADMTNATNLLRQPTDVLFFIYLTKLLVAQTIYIACSIECYDD